METDILLGTQAGALLEMQLPSLLEKWNDRQNIHDATNWIGFGVTLDPHDPEIVFFTKAGVADNQPFFDTILPDSKREIIQATFQTIPGGGKNVQEPARHGPGPPGTQPGDDIEAKADGGSVRNDGTLGVFLVDEANARWVLSANHVIGFNGQFPDVSVKLPRTGLELSQPRCIKVFKDLPNAADAAVASCLSSEGISAAIPRLPLATVNPAATPASRTKVLKVGNTTPIPVPGSLSYLAVRIEVSQDNSRAMGFDSCTFTNQWVIQGPVREFAQSGDSGALVVAQQDARNFPLGLLIAVQRSKPGDTIALSIATPLQSILNGFEGKTFRIDPATSGEHGNMAPTPFTLQDAAGQAAAPGR